MTVWMNEWFWLSSFDLMWCLSHPDMTYAVDWALKANCLSICLSTADKEWFLPFRHVQRRGVLQHRAGEILQAAGGGHSHLQPQHLFHAGQWLAHLARLPHDGGAGRHAPHPRHARATAAQHGALGRRGAIGRVIQEQRGCPPETHL